MPKIAEFTSKNDADAFVAMIKEKMNKRDCYVEAYYQGSIGKVFESDHSWDKHFLSGKDAKKQLLEGLEEAERYSPSSNKESEPQDDIDEVEAE